MDIKRRVVTCQSNGKSKVSGRESGIGEVRNSLVGVRRSGDRR